MPKSNRHTKKPRQRNKAAKPRLPKGDFWQHKTAEEIAKEQGIPPVTNLDELIGAGRNLWRSDKEFEDFLAGIYERRRRG